MSFKAFMNYCVLLNTYLSIYILKMALIATKSIIPGKPNNPVISVDSMFMLI